MTTRYGQATCLGVWRSLDFGPYTGHSVVLDQVDNGDYRLYIYGYGPMQTYHYQNRDIAKASFDRWIADLKDKP